MIRLEVRKKWDSNGAHLRPDPYAVETAYPDMWRNYVKEFVMSNLSAISGIRLEKRENFKRLIDKRERLFPI